MYDRGKKSTDSRPCRPGKQQVTYARCIGCLCRFMWIRVWTQKHYWNPLQDLQRAQTRKASYVLQPDSTMTDENCLKHLRSTHQSNHNTSQYPYRPGKTCQWWPSWPVGHLQALLKASWSSPQGRRKSRPWSHSRQGCQSCSHRSHRWTQQSQSRQRSEPIQQLAPWKLLQVRWGCLRTSGLRMETRSLALAA